MTMLLLTSDIYMRNTSCRMSNDEFDGFDFVSSATLSLVSSLPVSVVKEREAIVLSTLSTDCISTSHPASFCNSPLPLQSFPQTAAPPQHQHLC